MRLVDRGKLTAEEAVAILAKRKMTAQGDALPTPTATPQATPRGVARGVPKITPLVVTIALPTIAHCRLPRLSRSQRCLRPPQPPPTLQPPTVTPPTGTGFPRARIPGRKEIRAGHGQPRTAEGRAEAGGLGQQLSCPTARRGATATQHRWPLGRGRAATANALHPGRRGELCVGKCFHLPSPGRIALPEASP